MEDSDFLSLNRITDELKFENFFEIVTDFTIFVDSKNIGVFQDEGVDYYIASYETKGGKDIIREVVKVIDFNKFIFIKYKCITQDLYFLADLFTNGKLNTNILDDLEDL